MTDQQQDMLPASSLAAIQKAGANHDTPALDDQKSHSQHLREAMFKGSMAYATQYKQDNPEARGLMTRIETLAYKPKPAAYRAFIIRLVDSWLSGTEESSETNLATVDRIRIRFAEHTFADNLLNKPLSASALSKIEAVAHEQGIKLNTKTYNTLSKIKRAARQGHLNPIHSEHLTIAATITATHFGHLKIERYREQEVVRIKRPDGTRRRIALADLRALADVVTGSEPKQADAVSNSIHSIVGNLVTKPGEPQNSVKTPVEVDIPSENITGICDQKLGEPEKPGLTERLVALRAELTPVTDTQHSSDYDPLCNL